MLPKWHHFPKLQPLIIQLYPSHINWENKTKPKLRHVDPIIDGKVGEAINGGRWARWRAMSPDRYRARFVKEGTPKCHKPSMLQPGRNTSGGSHLIYMAKVWSTYEHRLNFNQQQMRTFELPLKSLSATEFQRKHQPFPRVMCWIHSRLHCQGLHKYI